MYVLNRELRRHHAGDEIEYVNATQPTPEASNPSNAAKPAQPAQPPTSAAPAVRETGASNAGSIANDDEDDEPPPPASFGESKLLIRHFVQIYKLALWSMFGGQALFGPLKKLPLARGNLLPGTPWEVLQSCSIQKALNVHCPVTRTTSDFPLHHFG